MYNYQYIQWNPLKSVNDHGYKSDGERVSDLLRLLRLPTDIFGAIIVVFSSVNVVTTENCPEKP
jgi:hypothetical protein